MALQWAFPAPQKLRPYGAIQICCVLLLLLLSLLIKPWATSRGKCKDLSITHALDWTGLQFAGSGVNSRIGIHVSRTRWVLSVLVSLPPISTTDSHEADSRDQWTRRVTGSTCTTVHFVSVLCPSVCPPVSFCREYTQSDSPGNNTDADSVRVGLAVRRSIYLLRYTTVWSNYKSIRTAQQVVNWLLWNFGRVKTRH